MDEKIYNLWAMKISNIVIDDFKDILSEYISFPTGYNPCKVIDILKEFEKRVLEEKKR